jgi:predicted ferric reductase
MNHSRQLERPVIVVGPRQPSTHGRPAAARILVTSRAAALLLLSTFVLFTTLPPIFILGTRQSDPLLYEIGKRAALLAFGLLTLQVVLSARFRFADRALGLDTLMRLHRAVGILALLLLLAHPTLLLVGSHGDIPFLKWQVLLGASALLVLAGGVLMALLFRFLRMDFNRWRVLHKAMILVVVLGGAHSRSFGQDLRSSPELRAWWTVLVMVAIGIFAWRNVFVPRWGLRHYRVDSIRAEARGIWTIKLVLERGSPLRHLPGQFMFLTLLQAGAPAEEHPFTISSSPSQMGFITATIKESGNFTRTIGLARPGDRALVDGPFGRFSFVHHPADRFLFISAGVGSTPIASMLRFLSDNRDPRPVLYLCANRSEADIAFREELARLPANVKVFHVLSQPGATWPGARGHLDDAAIRRLAGGSLDGAAVFLCGPPAFMSSARKSLRSLGVPRARIHLERFTVP